jgi:hypothetical protein
LSKDWSADGAPTTLRTKRTYWNHPAFAAFSGEGGAGRIDPVDPQPEHAMKREEDPIVPQESLASEPRQEADFTASVRDTAYFLWEQDGRPMGRDDYYWHLALEQHLRTRAFDVWLREGRPDGRDEAHWHTALKDIGG